MEKDDEVKGSSGMSYDFGARMYDSRLGRWLAVDPLADGYPSFSPYSFVNNMPIWAIDPDGMKIRFKGSVGSRIKMKMVLRFMRRNSVSFKTVYKQLKDSKNLHTIHLLKPIPLKKMNKDQILDHNKRRHYIGKYKDKKFEKGELLESEKTWSTNANGKNAAVISDSELHNDWLKQNNKLTEANTKEDDSNGVGEGSNMVYGVKAVSKRGELYKLHGESDDGISRIAHEWKHMSEIDNGTLKERVATDAEKVDYKSRGISEGSLNKTKLSEINGVDFQNKVSKEVSNKTGKKTSIRTDY